MLLNTELIRNPSSTTLDVGTLINPASNPRRIVLLDLEIGSDSTPGDNAVRIEVGRRSSASTGGSNPTIIPSDDGDSFTPITVAVQAPTGGGTVVAGILLAVPMNSRTTYRWFAVPGRELVVSATNSRGLGFASPVAGGTPGLTLGVQFEER